MNRLSGILLAIALVMASVAAVAQTGAGRSGKRLSLPDMVEKAEQRIEEMRTARDASFTELEDARKSGDIQRLGCVNEAQTAIKGLVRLAEQNWVGLQEAAARQDASMAEHEFVKLTLAATKVGELSTQLKACAGPTVSTETEGKPEMEVISDDDLPPTETADPASWFSDTEVILQEPAASSPFI